MDIVDTEGCVFRAGRVVRVAQWLAFLGFCMLGDGCRGPDGRGF